MDALVAACAGVELRAEVEVRAESGSRTGVGGPRTRGGKKRSSGNAVKLGMYAAGPVVAGENFGAWDRLRRGLVKEWRPGERTELLLVERMAGAEWKLRRLERAEEAFYAGDGKGGSVVSAARAPARAGSAAGAGAGPAVEPELLAAAEGEERGWAASVLDHVDRRTVDGLKEGDGFLWRLSMFRQRLVNESMRCLRELQRLEDRRAKGKGQKAKGKGGDAGGEVDEARRERFCRAVLRRYAQQRRRWERREARERAARVAARVGRIAREREEETLRVQLPGVTTKWGSLERLTVVRQARQYGLDAAVLEAEVMRVGQAEPDEGPARWMMKAVARAKAEKEAAEAEERRKREAAEREAVAGGQAARGEALAGGTGSAGAGGAAEGAGGVELVGGDGVVVNGGVGGRADAGVGVEVGREANLRNELGVGEGGDGR